MSNLDPLTQVYNRQAIIEIVTREYEQSFPSQSSFFFLYCNINFFKEYNEFYGFPEGDILLKTVAQALKSSMGVYLNYNWQLIGRWRADKFCVFLPQNLIKTKAINCAKHIIKEIKKNQIYASSISHITENELVTISIIISAVHPNSKFSGKQIIEITDDALYISQYKLGFKSKYDLYLLELNNSQIASITIPDYPYFQHSYPLILENYQ